MHSRARAVTEVAPGSCARDVRFPVELVESVTALGRAIGHPALPFRRGFAPRQLQADESVL